jgi:uncharacterized protein YqeY
MPAAEPLRTRLRRALPVALKARDAAAVAALRSTLGALDNAEAVAAPAAPTTGGVIAGARVGIGAGEADRRTLSEEEVAAIVGTEVAERVEAADDYRRAGHPDRAARLTAEADVLRAHLAGP